MDWVVRFGMVVAILVIGVYAITIFNGLIRLKHSVTRAWANIDVLLTQRHAELPKLVDTVAAYMKHEREVLRAITEARHSFEQARSVGEKADADVQIHAALEKLVAVAENYPELKADTVFGELIERISALEDSIADRRELFNHAVTSYNVRIQQIPDLLIAAPLGMGRPRELFKAVPRHRADVKIDLPR